jgi:two-component system LytT family response regulator
MKIKALLIDDEKTSRNVLRSYLQKYCPDVEILGEAENVTEAVAAIKTFAPHLIFLDVEMPQGNGFDLLEAVGEQPFETIFVTAFDQYAIQALNYSAAYYLLKPVSIDELIQAVDKVRSSIQSQQIKPHARVLLENFQVLNEQQKKLVLPLMEGFEVVKLEEIVSCEAHDNFTDFHFANRPKMMICRTLKFYEELLSQSGFLRVHKSHLVNLHHITKYHKGKGGEVIMSDGQHIAVSSQKKDQLLAHFSMGR